MNSDKVKYLVEAHRDNYYSVDEASQELGIKTTAIRNYLYAGKLTTYKFKGLTLLSTKEVEGWKERQR